MLFRHKPVGVPAATDQTSPLLVSRLRSKRSLTCAAMLCAVSALTLSEASPWPTYVVYPIARVNNERNFALALNNYSEVAGNTQSTTPGQSLGMLGGVNLLTTAKSLPPSSTFLSFLGLNDSKVAVGYSRIGGYPQAVSYRNGVTTQLFHQDRTHPGSEAIGVNASDQALGWEYVIDEGGHEHVSMFRYNISNNTFYEWPDTYAGGINNQGVIAASPDNYTLTQTPELQLMIDDLTVDDYNYFPPTSFGRVFPAAISDGNADVGQGGGVAVVGDYETKTVNGTGTKRDGFLFTEFNHNWYSMLDPSGNNFETDPLAIDPYAQNAVGYAIDKFGNHIAVGWANTGNHMDWAPAELHTVFGDPSGWKFTDATAINEYGAISGYGVYNGAPTSFVAVPADLFRFSLTNANPIGGAAVTGVVQMTRPLNSLLTLRGTSSDGSATMPRTVNVSNDEPVRFTIQTSPVKEKTTVTLTLALGGVTKTVEMAVFPSITR